MLRVSDEPIDASLELRQFQTLTHPGLMGRAFKVAEFRREGTGRRASDLAR